jgi:hypothetical protein
VRPPKPQRLQEHELRTLQVAGLALCRAIYAGDCHCFDKQHRPPGCTFIMEAAGQMVAKIRAAEGRAQA